MRALSDAFQVTQLLLEYLARFRLAPVFSEEEVLHYLLPVEGVIDSYVVENSGVRRSCQAQHVTVSAHL